jgi:uncharacterized protein YcnI
VAANIRALLCRVSLIGLIAIALTVLYGAAPAGAHGQLQPSAAAPGSIVDVTLTLANERSDAGIVRVQLQFPPGTGLTLVSLPTSPGWVATAVGGSAGGPATGLDWSRPSGPPRQNAQLQFTVGPLPPAEGQLQFKVVQTYDNGDVDRWIEDWPAGSPEPERPGPVLKLQAGAAGTIPPTTAAPVTTISMPPTNAPATTAPPAQPSPANGPTTDPATAPTTDPASPRADNGSTAPLIFGIIAIVVIAAGGCVYLVLRRRGHVATRR